MRAYRGPAMLILTLLAVNSVLQAAELGMLIPLIDGLTGGQRQRGPPPV